MKKKIIILAIILAMGNSVSVFAKTGIGVIGSYGINTGSGGGAVSLSSPIIPGTILNVTLSANASKTYIGISDDWWFYNEPLFGDFALYAGIGGYVQMEFTSYSTNFNLGARVPVGLRLFPLPIMEIFIEVVPVLGLDLDPFYFPVWDVQGGFGVRFWFDF